MSDQPELPNIQPRELLVSGHELADTVAELQAKGVLIARMEQGRSNSEWRLSLCWPQHQQEHHAN